MIGHERLVGIKRAIEWERYKPQTTGRPRECVTCTTTTRWPDFGWWWRWKEKGQGTESVCPKCHAERVLALSRKNVRSTFPDRCDKCESTALATKANYVRCFICGWDCYVKGDAVKKIAVIVGGLLACLMLATPTLADSPTSYITIADKTLSTAASIVCPVRPTRVGCNCTNNDGSINVRYGDSSTSATQGQRISANNGAATMTAGTAIYMASESGAPVVSCTDEVR